jgi:site-specific DNA-methyltransferase (adenine-specific)
VSAPRTPDSLRTTTRKRTKRDPDECRADFRNRHSTENELFHRGLLEAYGGTYSGYSLDRVIADPELNDALADACQGIGLPGEPRTWNQAFFRLRKARVFAQFPTEKRTEFSWSECEPYLFASEIAWKHMIDQGCESLDSILCDPSLANEFDTIAKRWAPGFTSLEYRWAALKLRKCAKDVRSRAKLLTDALLSPSVAINGKGRKSLPDIPGVYVVVSRKDEPLYAGEASNIRERVRNQFNTQTRPWWRSFAKDLAAKYFSTSSPYSTRMAYQRRLVIRHSPVFNLPEPKIR